jgi:hypothetical protein
LRSIRGRIEPRALPEQSLGHRDRERRGVLRDVARDRERGRQHLGRRHHARRETELLASCASILRPVSRRSAARLTPTIRGSVKCAVRIGHHAAAHLDHAVLPLAREDPQIALERHREAEADRVAVHRGDHRLADRERGRIERGGAEVGGSRAANVSAPGRSSAPVQKASPAPVSTTARIASSLSQVR